LKEVEFFQRNILSRKASELYLKVLFISKSSFKFSEIFFVLDFFSGVTRSLAEKLLYAP